MDSSFLVQHIFLASKPEQVRELHHKDQESMIYVSLLCPVFLSEIL